MHRINLNRARFELRLVPVTPLLIKSGDKGASLLHPERPDLMFVRTERGGEEETVYIPGSSLKGVVRSSAERILRSLDPGWSCDPMDQQSRCMKDASRKGDDLQRGGDALRMAQVYRLLCLACRTFGSQAMGSRVSFADAYPPALLLAQTNATEARSGVSIDRKTGGPAARKLFQYEVVTAGGFDTEILIANYELWQLALIGLVLREIQEGFVRLGSAKSRGLGRVTVEFRRLVIDQMRESGGRVAGVGALIPALREPYRLLESEPLSGVKAPEPSALGQRFDLRGKEVDQVLNLLLGRPWQQLCERAHHEASSARR
jgi:CRISPR-associated RAMP protein (TIGR02581 family)